MASSGHRSRDAAPGDAGPPEGYAALLNRQDALQREAEQVIGELALREHLGRLGPFEQIGSSVSGLMAWRDIDVGVRCADPPAARVLEAMQPILAHPGIRHVLYRPELGPRSPSGGPHDQRHYYVLRYESRAGKLWKIDISLWQLGDAPRMLLFDAETLRRELSAETRAAILWIKDAWYRRPSYPEAVGGPEIYDAVLRHGVRSPAGFAAYLRERGLPED